MAAASGIVFIRGVEHSAGHAASLDSTSPVIQQTSSSILDFCVSCSAADSYSLIESIDWFTPPALDSGREHFNATVS